MIMCYGNRRLELKKGMVSMAHILGIAPPAVKQIPTDKKLHDEWVIAHMTDDALEGLHLNIFCKNCTLISNFDVQPTIDAHNSKKLKMKKDDSW